MGHTQLVGSGHDEGSRPGCPVSGREPDSQVIRKPGLFFFRDSHQQDAVVAPWREPPHILEIQILSDEEPILPLGSLPNGVVVPAAETFIQNGIHIMPQDPQAYGGPRGDVLVQLEPHHAAWVPLGGGGGEGRSSAAEAAAKAIQPQMWSRVKLG